MTEPNRWAVPLEELEGTRASEQVVEVPTGPESGGDGDGD